ncbi:hypothetical protein SeMB42_g03414 [Synchytrium endobioticum]|uniref:Uncharacterized protein n=1 Tax=Synchytrium endobioticum TaxID=286115 RepID=A0A507D7B0_9FUNG|nr:hypothetical protein SeMB42_g03414 [Synchytrium endobioticum]
MPPKKKDKSKSKKGSEESSTETGADKNVELKIEELDEKLLKSRLDALDKELTRFKTECDIYKKENEWYRNEIESTERDAADYVRYLEAKKSARQDAINQLAESEKRDLEACKKARDQKDRENKVRIEDLRQTAADLEAKIELKNTEIADLSEIIARRGQHQAEIASIQHQMREAEERHAAKLLELEQEMMNERLEMQKLADQRVREMESAAHEKAIVYLHQHYQELEEQNIKMETELRRMAIAAQDLLHLKLKLEETNQELAREHRVFMDVSRLRREKAAKEQAKAVLKKQRKELMLASRNAVKISDS